MEVKGLSYILSAFLLINSGHVLGIDLYVVSFLDHKNSPSELSCFDEKGKFNEMNCSREETDCSFEHKFSSFNTVPVMLQMRDDFFKYKRQGEGFTLRTFVENDVKNYYSIMPSSQVFSAKTIKLGNQLFPVGAQATIYESKSSRSEMEISIYRQFKVTEDSTLENVYPIPAIHKLKIEFLDINHHKEFLSLQVFNDHVYKDQQQNTFEFTLSEGDYSFAAIIRSGNQEKKLNFKYKITKDPKHANGASNKILSFKKEQFKESPSPDVNNKINHTLLWKTEGYPLTKKTMKMGVVTSGDSTKGLYFKELKEFRLIEENKELKDMVQIENGFPSIQDVKHSAFLNLINQKPFHTLKVTGICYTTEKKPQLNEYEISTKPTENSTKVGKIIIEVSSDGNDASVFYQKDRTTPREKFQVNLMEGSCRGESTAEVLHVVKETHGNWANLGKGPWGNEGWIKASFSELANGSGRYELNGLNNVTFSKVKDNLIKVSGDDFSRSETEITEPGEESPEVKVEYNIEPEKLFTPDGRFLGSIDCSYGC